ncbi:hypothetical protein ACFSVJ_02790 [Prauserella oleivorans]
MAEDVVAQQRKRLDPVGRLAEGEQGRRHGPRVEQVVESTAQVGRVVEPAADGMQCCGSGHEHPFSKLICPRPYR